MSACNLTHIIKPIRGVKRTMVFMPASDSRNIHNYYLETLAALLTLAIAPPLHNALHHIFKII